MPVFFFSCITFLLLLLLLLLSLLVLAAAAFFHFVGSYADSVEIERRSQSRRWAHSTKSQSPIFAEHFSSESLTQLFFSHRSFASAAKCNRTLACHIVWMWIYIYIYSSHRYTCSNILAFYSNIIRKKVIYSRERNGIVLTLLPSNECEESYTEPSAVTENRDGVGTINGRRGELGCERVCMDSFWERAAKMTGTGKKGKWRWILDAHSIWVFCAPKMKIRLGKARRGRFIGYTA